MAHLTLQQLQQLAASVGFPDPALAAAIAMAESGGNPNAYTTEGSYGLFQIDVVYNPKYASNPSVLLKGTFATAANFASCGPSPTASESPMSATRLGLRVRASTRSAPPAATTRPPATRMGRGGSFMGQ